MNLLQARELKRWDRVIISKDDVKFLAEIVDKDDNALSFIEKLLDPKDEITNPRTGIVSLRHPVD